MTHFPLASVSRHSSYQLLCFPQMISLEGISDSEGDVSATLALMAKVIRRVQVEVLRARFGDFAKRLDNIISLYQESGNGSLLVNVRQIYVVVFLICMLIFIKIFLRFSITNYGI